MLNKVTLMGRLTKDPELNATPKGTAISNFSIAVDRDFVRQGEERQTDFINIVTFGPKAEFVNRFFRKGQLIAIVGRIQTRSWDDPQTGQKRYATDVMAEEVHFAGSKEPTTAAPGVSVPTATTPAQPQQGNYEYQGFGFPIDDENLPF